MKDAHLCYVDGNFAYFTTRHLYDQCGDDWNDVPYEHNAGAPYEPHWRTRSFTNADGSWDPYRQIDLKMEDQPDFHSKGNPKWEIIKIAFDGSLCPPCEGFTNSPYSVEKINAKMVPWLADRYGSSNVAIFAGCSIQEFCELIRKAGGEVYFPAE